MASPSMAIYNGDLSARAANPSSAVVMMSFLPKLASVPLGKA
jgi:hypothetical protein